MGTELLLSVGSPSIRSLSSHGDSSSGVTSLSRNTAQGHCEEQQNGGAQVEGHPTTIAMLPDNVLLEIFDFYRKDHYRKYYYPDPNDYYAHGPVWKWHLLVHVCQTWRQVIFASPHRLDVKILCTYGTPIRKILAIWPAFPIVIRYERSRNPIIRIDDVENITFALKHHDRVCDVELDPGLQWSERPEIFDALAAVQEPFPVLKRLRIHSMYEDSPASVLPAKFLGGSAPCLQKIYISGIPYPALPMLLLSTSDLVRLVLHDIPPTGYIPPEAMVASLATLPRLDSLSIEFQSPTPRPDIGLHPVTRTVLPALTSLHFLGASEYLEDLVSRIDSPQLKRIFVDYRWLVDYRVTQLSKFIDRSVGPKLTLSRRARVSISSNAVSFIVYLV
ncbi:hypothetical protein H4582DRAFT_367240 [Lactarius indigo]|nr:hypothetical protein H4582DRAFT_367240 [Lactarius indigo]